MPRPGTPVTHPRMLVSVQAVAVASMRDVARLLRPASAGTVYDDTTGEYTPAAPAVLWTGVCRVQPDSGVDREDVGGEQRITLRRYQVTVPMSAPPAQVGDLIEVTASIDPALIGTRLEVRDVRLGDYQAQRHLVCDDNQG